MVNEIGLMKAVRSPQVIDCFEAYYYKDRFWLVLELMATSFTPIVSKMKKDKTEAFYRYTLYQTVKGLVQLHKQNIIHRDIKSDNILCSENGDIKLADFGFAVMLTKQQSRRTSRVGSVCWMAPELIQAKQDRQYSKKVDIWSLGIFAIELAHGDPPYIDVEPTRALFNIVQQEPPRLSSKMSFEFQDFVSRCL